MTLKYFDHLGLIRPIRSAASECASCFSGQLSSADYPPAAVAGGLR